MRGTARYESEGRRFESCRARPLDSYPSSVSPVSESPLRVQKFLGTQLYFEVVGVEARTWHPDAERLRVGARDPTGGLRNEVGMIAPAYPHLLIFRVGCCALSSPVGVSYHRQRSDPKTLFLDHHDASPFERVGYSRQLPQK